MNNNLDTHQIDEEYITKELLETVFLRKQYNKELSLSDEAYVSPYMGAQEPIKVCLGDFLTKDDILYGYEE